MRKIYTCIAATFFAVAALAQTEKGNWMMGGSLALDIVSENSTISFDPTVGVFIVNNFALGLNIDLGYAKLGDNKASNFGIGPFARYYFGSTTIRPFLHGDINYATQKLNTSTSDNTESGVSYLLAGGIAAFLNRTVAIETIAGYKHTKLSDSEGDGGFSLRIGFQIYLNPRSTVEAVSRNY